jgi:hypothetical protein
MHHNISIAINITDKMSINKSVTNLFFLPVTEYLEAQAENLRARDHPQSKSIWQQN